MGSIIYEFYKQVRFFSVYRCRILGDPKADFFISWKFWCFGSYLCTASWDELGHQKTPEMSELEADKYAVKIWAHNFAKQKN